LKYTQARALVLAGQAAGASVTIQALCEVYAVLTTRGKRRHAEANAAIEILSGNLRVIEPTTQEVLRATQLCEQHSVSFWDAFMICVAVSGGSTALITEDLQDGRRFSAADAGRSILIVNPFDDNNLARLSAEGLRI